MRNRSWTIGTLCFITLGAPIIFSACKKNPIDVAIDAALESAFNGFFEAGDGTQLELNSVQASAVLRRLGSALTGMNLKAGDQYMIGMAPTGKPGEYRGDMRTKSGFFATGNVTIANGRLSIVWDRPTDAIAALSSFSKIATPPSTPSTPTTPTTPSTGSTDLLYLKNLDGNEGSTRTYTVTVPTGAKTLVVKTFEEDASGHNLADLFVRKGAAPIIRASPYSWTADCASVNSNRDDEICTFTNPTAGATYYITVYGYHAYYATSLRVTYSK